MQTSPNLNPVQAAAMQKLIDSTAGFDDAEGEQLRDLLVAIMREELFPEQLSREELDLFDRARKAGVWEALEKVHILITRDKLAAWHHGQSQGVILFRWL